MVLSFNLASKNYFEFILHGTPAIQNKSLECGFKSPSLKLAKSAFAYLGRGLLEM